MSEPSGIARSRSLPTTVGRFLALVAVVTGMTLALQSSPASAATTIGLGTAQSFGVVAGSGISNTGPTTVTGDIGTFPTTTQSGFGSISQVGTNHAGDAVTQQAKTDLTTAYNQAAGSLPFTSVANELGGTTLTPGVYRGATLAITGNLTLDTQGDPNAVFIFQTGSTLVTASSSTVTVIGSSLACNVFWQVPSSATLGTASHLVGTVLASTSITATTGATVQGRLLAENGAVTLDTNTISIAGCGTPTATTTTTVPSTAAPTTTAPVASGRPTASGAAVPARPTTRRTTTGGSTSRSPGTPGTPGIPPLAFTGGVDLELVVIGFGSLLLGAALVVSGARARLRSRNVVADRQ